MAETTNDSSEGPTDRALRELLDAEQHRTHLEERRRRQSLRRQADDAVLLRDLLRSLAERRAWVEVTSRAGLLPHAELVRLGIDHVVLRDAGGSTRLVPLDRIAAVVPVPGEAHLVPRRGAGPALDLREQLAELSARRQLVRLEAAAGAVTGRLRCVGADVLVVDDGATEALVALAALDEVLLVQSSSSPLLSPEPTTSG